MLLQKAREAYKWDLNLGGIALMWRGGCIIRRLVFSPISITLTPRIGLFVLLPPLLKPLPW